MFRWAALPTVAAMEHPNATFARNLYAALAAGDLATAFDALADDLVLINDVGAGPWRELHGKQAVLEFWGQWMELFDGTFRQEVMYVLGYDDRIVLVIHETGTAQGQAFEHPRDLPRRDRRWEVVDAAHNGHGPGQDRGLLGRGAGARGHSIVTSAAARSGVAARTSRSGARLPWCAPASAAMSSPAATSQGFVSTSTAASSGPRPGRRGRARRAPGAGRRSPGAPVRADLRPAA